MHGVNMLLHIGLTASVLRVAKAALWTAFGYAVELLIIADLELDRVPGVLVIKRRLALLISQDHLPGLLVPVP